jgi:hypothetical protein
MVTLTLELDTEDALAMLTATQDGALTWRLHAVEAKGPLEREYAECRARMLQAAATQIVDQMIPKTRLDRIGREEFEAEYELGML